MMLKKLVCISLFVFLISEVTITAFARDIVDEDSATDEIDLVELEELDEEILEKLEEKEILTLEEQQELEELRELCGYPYPASHLSSLAFLPPNFTKYFQFYLNWKNVYDNMIVSFSELPGGAFIENNTLKYTVSNDDSLAIIADKFIMSTKYYSSSQLKNGILKFNDLDEFTARNGDDIVIPGFQPIRLDKKPQYENLRGIYFTAYTASSTKGRDMSEKMVNYGGNLIVFDIKNVDGIVLFDTKAKLANEFGLIEPVYYDLKKYIQYLHDQNIYAVARIVVFKDDNLPVKRPDLAIKSKTTGEPWENSEGVVWLDPSKQEVQDYIIELSKEIAGMGVDEIQYDYIRFPAMGDLEDMVFDFDELYVSKHQILTGFLNRAKRELAPYGVKVGIDVFGVVVWNDGYDAKTTGQRMECLSQYTDSIYPMVYPSHFNAGFAGIDNPADSPYFFINESLKLFRKLTYGTNTRLVTWIQGFPYLTNNFGPQYVQTQVEALEDLGYMDFAVWSASNSYDASWAAL